MWKPYLGKYNDSGYWFKVKGDKHVLKRNIIGLNVPKDIEQKIFEFCDKNSTEKFNFKFLSE